MSDLADQFVFLAMSVVDEGVERVEAARWSSDASDREFEFAELPRRRSRAKSGGGLTALTQLEATVRRWSAGRTVLALDVDRLRDRLTTAGWRMLPPVIDIAELVALVAPHAGHATPLMLGSALGVAVPQAPAPGDAVRAAAEAFFELTRRFESYDDATFERICLLATQAGWSSSTLLQMLLQRRTRGNGATGELSSSELAFMTHRERPDLLKSTKSSEPIDPAEIARVLGGRGPLSSEVPGFELRRQQVEMAEQVGDVLNQDGWLLAEAGTGTGKSLAYLVPSALHALERGERVVISTNTRALQDQLLEKEIPAVASAIGQNRLPPLTASALKGRANYLCLRRWFGADRQPVKSPADAAARAKVHAWLPITAAGERAELELSGDEERQFDAFSAEGEACIPARCPFQQRNQCFLYRARRTAEGSHLVVVNHALLLSDLAQGGGVIPDYERVIVDEAHNLEEQATSHFGFSVSEASAAEAVDRIVKLDGPGISGVLTDAAMLVSTSALTPKEQERAAAASERLRAAGERARRAKTTLGELFLSFRAVCRAAGAEDAGYGRSLRLIDSVRQSDAFTDCEIVFDTLAEILRKLDEDLRCFIDALDASRPTQNGGEAVTQLQEEIQVGLETERENLAELSARLGEAVLSPEAGSVYWIEIASGMERTSIHAAPLHVGELLRERLFERMRTVVLTSATLTAGGGFGYIKERLGFEEAEELKLESPFNYKNAALLYLVDDIPEPHLPGYTHAVNQALVGLGSALHGRTLVLFTSYAAMRSACAAVKPAMAAAGIEVLAQRIDGNPASLVERFRSSTGAMLLGVATFWEGIDVVGPALSALVIAKLPFSVPSEPVFAARGELFDDPFRQYSTPQAVLKFKQGFGRLIRSSQDRGVCVVLDRRIISKHYGKSFVLSAPPCTVEIGGAERLPERAAAWVHGGSPEGEGH